MFRKLSPEFLEILLKAYPDAGERLWGMSSRDILSWLRNQKRYEPPEQEYGTPTHFPESNALANWFAERERAEWKEVNKPRKFFTPEEISPERAKKNFGAWPTGQSED